jgi:uncharacterized hydrophobic protein (TIGR00341 family)
LKRIELIVEPGRDEAIESELQSSQITYFKSDGTSYGKPSRHYVIIAPDEIANSLVERLASKVNFEEKLNVIDITKTDATVSSYLEKLAEKLRGSGKETNPVEQLVSAAERYTILNRTPWIMTMIAAIIALVGLFGDNPAIVIGGMLLSPLLGPINAFSVNAALGKIRKMARVTSVAFTLVLSVILVSAGITYAASFFAPLQMTHEIQIRTSVSMVDIAVALLLGVAGSLAIVGDLAEVLVGVAVAVALVPPAVVVGIGIALFSFPTFAGALLLTISNILGLELGGTATFTAMEVLPRRRYEKRLARKYSLYTLLILVLLALALVAMESLTHI